MKGEIYNEGKIFCKAYLREMQGYQEKRKRQNYLRKSKTQTETGLISPYSDRNSTITITNSLCAAAVEHLIRL